MAREVTGMLKDSLRAFTDGDLELAHTLKPGVTGNSINPTGKSTSR